MRILVSIVALLALSACATAPAATPVSTATTPSAAAPSGSQQSRAAQLLSRAGAASAPTQAEVERVFGPADIARQEGAGAALTYRYDNCALLLLFNAGANNAMHLAEAHPSARRAGAAAPSLEQCAAEAMARRS